MSDSRAIASNRPLLAHILERLYWSYYSSGEISRRHESGCLLLWFCGRIEGASKLTQHDIVEFARRVAHGDALVGYPNSPPPQLIHYGGTKGGYRFAYEYTNESLDLRPVETRLAELDADGTTDSLWRELCRRSPEAASALQQPKESVESPATLTGAMDREAVAIALLWKRPELSISGIAEAVGVTRQTPYGWPRFLKAAQAAGKYAPKEPKGGGLPHGTKSPDGTVEAWQDMDSEGD